MKLSLLPPKKSLSKAFLKQRPLKSDIVNFRNNLSKLLSKINEIEREENQKNHIRDFLLNSFYKDTYEVNTKDVKDLVIHTGKSNKSSVGVIIETKRPGNKNEMISKDKLNCKAFQELVLYYLHERIDEKNIDVKYCIATNIYEWFIFDASYFEKYFYSDKKFVKQYEEWRKGQKVTGDTNLFYNEIARPYIDSIDEEIPVVYFDLRDFTSDPEKQDEDKDRNLIALFKLLSPYHLLRVSFADDSNKLDEKFYKELLHIIGLEEVKEGSKHIIRRREKEKRDAGSLIENAISKLAILDSSDRVSDSSNYGDTKEEKNFNIALELCLTWINRILFLKLLEAQLVIYHKGMHSDNYKFLYPGKLKDFDELFSLFHHVLAVPEKEREADVREKFRLVPYLNSTLFEISKLEKETISISNLNDSLSLDLISNSILRDKKTDTKNLTSLEYILRFLDAYDFSSEGTEEVMEESRTLINASVLGKVFEKINGYKDGSIFTPGFITMYMCREAIRLAVTQKFKDKYNWKADTFEDVKNFIADKRGREDVKEFNEVIDSIKICDPAVGSGHFLVSSLNEMIAIKSELGIFADEYGSRITDYDISVEQDELIITDKNGDIFDYRISPSPSGEGFRVRSETQKLQRTLFHEKQKLIENCLFGVDINPNSVKICMLRLWIELLKNAYYKEPTDSTHSTNSTYSTTNELETLPNIDINIKTGNSLISRFPLDSNLSKFGQKEKNIIEQYRTSVSDYKNERNRNKKKELEGIIRSLKNDIRTDISKKDPKLLKLNNLKSELDNLENQTGLFEQSMKEQKEQAAKKKKLEAELAKINKEVDDIRSNAIYRNAFEWRFEFPEVLNDEGEFEGFDVVIGNPPYISHDKIIEKDYLKTKYSTFEPFADLYCYFYELGIELLSKGGILEFITSNSFLRAEYGLPLRKFFINNGSINTLINLEDAQIFQEAIVNIVILGFSKVKLDNKSLIVNSIYKNENFYEFISQNKFYYTPSDFDTITWNLLKPDKLAIGKKIDSLGLKLKDLETQINLGLATGSNEAFIIDEKKKEELFKLDANNKSIIKPVLRGRDIQKYDFRFGNIYIILSRNEVNVERDFPNIFKHLDSFGDKFKKRGAKGKHWTNLRACSFFEDFKKEKIIWIELSDENRFALSDEEIYLLNSAYFLIPPKEFKSKYLLSVLNSKVIKFYLNLIANTSGMGTTRWINIYVKEFPIPNIHFDEQQAFVNLVDIILESKKQRKDTAALEDKIDRMVYELYGLTEEEIRIVEGKS